MSSVDDFISIQELPSGKRYADVIFFAVERCGEAGAGCGVEVGSRGGRGD